jgi:hypothetical protein
MLSLSPKAEVGSESQVFNLWLLLLLLLLCIWLCRRRTHSLPTTGVSFQATQDIFSFCSVFPFLLNFPRRQSSSPRRGTPMRVGF